MLTDCPVLDVGGESTRPGHAPVTAEIELSRVVPLIERLVERVCDWFRARGVSDIAVLEARAPETVVFRLPRELSPFRVHPVRTM